MDGTKPSNMTQCMICNKNNTSLGFVFHNYNVYSCSNCGFQWLSPQPTDKELAEIYSDSYYLGDKDDEEMVNVLKRGTASLYLDQLLMVSNWNKSELNSRSVLEIGCGRGDFLLEARSQGFNVSGLEVNDHLVRLANQRLGSDFVKKGDIEASSFKTESFDAIVLFDVIEHVRNPELFLHRVKELLKATGRVYMATPSLDSWSARLFRKQWMEYKVEHLSYFNRKSLKLLLEKTGFRNVRFMPNYKILNIDYINHHFVRFPVKGFTPLMGSLRRIIPEKLARMPIKLIASGMAVIAES
jgi:2-polyprenyl-3-methyl-5-hydroxy-6-metoxy-1,4-benzoquinol methylase